MTALPLQMPLLTARELAQLRVLFHQEALFEAATAFRRQLDELAHMRLTRPNLEDWGARSHAILASVFKVALELMSNLDPELLQEVGADLERQRLELAAFLRPLEAADHAEYAICALALCMHVSLEHLANNPGIDLQAEWQRIQGTADATRIGGAMLRLMGFLTLALENAQSGRPPGERDAVYARAAFLEATTLVAAMAADGIRIEPLDYMRTPRRVVGAAALRRLATTEGDAESRALFQSLLGD